MPGLKIGTGWFSAVDAPPGPGTHEGDVVPRQGEDGREPPGQRILGGAALARVVMLVVVSCFVAVVMLELVSTPFPSRALALGVGITSLVMLFALMVWVTSASAEHWPLWQRLAVLLAEGLVIYLPMIVFGEFWAGTGLAGFFAGSAMLLLSGGAAWALFAAAVGSMLVGGVVAAAVVSDLTGYDVAYLTLSTLVLGLVVFGLTRLSQLVRYVTAKRGELAQLAVIRERMRFARDLHDLLGYSLSAITLKAEVTRRMVGVNPGRARDELGEVLDIARQALADVRIVASGYRNISLAKEASSVSSLLAAAGIDAEVEVDCGLLDEKVDTVLATVLREAVTNMLRHSTARHCSIQAGITGETIRLRVANDGVPHSAAAARDGGGLENLSTRMAAIGGSLSARVDSGGWFEVLAEAPPAPSMPRLASRGLLLPRAASRGRRPDRRPARDGG
jgi:two-component system, NarL family, sensor histidine kinase DesK